MLKKNKPAKAPPLNIFYFSTYFFLFFLSFLPNPPFPSPSNSKTKELTMVKDLKVNNIVEVLNWMCQLKDLKLERIREKSMSGDMLECSIITRSFTSKTVVPSWGSNFVQVDVALAL